MSNTVEIHPALAARLDGEIPPRLDENGNQVRCILMYSGGLDSTLAGILLRRFAIGCEARPKPYSELCGAPPEIMAAAPQ